MKSFRTTTKRECEQLAKGLQNNPNVIAYEIIKVVGGYALIYDTSY